MKKCTETDNTGTGSSLKDRPLISIVLATYNPRMDWLKEQLASLEKQTYRPLELIVIDDCSSKVDMTEISSCVEDCIKSIPYRIMQNEENLGSTKTFEKLTMLAEGKYIAYCDQDDVWHENKLEKSLEALENTDGVLAFSDMNIIDGVGNLVADSITKVRRHHKFYSGEGLSRVLLFSNFVTGCTILMKTKEAKNAIPFCPYMVHDHWLALYCSVDKKLIFIDNRLLNYRIHASNQTLMMAGVKDKESYLKIRIEEALYKFIWLSERFVESDDLSLTISQAIEWMKARQAHFQGSFKSIKLIWIYREFSFLTSIFEIFTPYIPERFFMFFIRLKKRNIL